MVKAHAILLALKAGVQIHVKFEDKESLEIQLRHGTRKFKGTNSPTIDLSHSPGVSKHTVWEEAARLILELDTNP